MVVVGDVRIYFDHGARPPCIVCLLTHIVKQGKTLVVGGVGGGKTRTQLPTHPPINIHLPVPTSPPCKVCSVTRIA